MSPRHFWNHPLQELARSFVQPRRPGEPAQLTSVEFAAFLGRLAGSAANGQLQPARAARVGASPSRYDAEP